MSAIGAAAVGKAPPTAA